jgi:hypothetical protein
VGLEVKAQPASMPPTDSPGRSKPNPRAEPREVSKPDGQGTEYRKRDQRCDGAYHELYSARGRPLSAKRLALARRLDGKIAACSTRKNILALCLMRPAFA